MTRYSYSRLNTYENCPLQYKLQYIEKIPSDEEGIEAFMGSRIHETFEKLYKDLILSKMNSIEEIIEFYNEQWEKEWHDNVFISKKDKSPEDYRKTGERAIRDYYAHYHPFDQNKTFWTERFVNFDLGDENYKLVGYIDRLDKTPEDTLEIHDYKGSGNLPTQAKFDIDRQLALYQLAVQESFPDAEKIELVWHYVLFDKEFRSLRTQEQLEELKAECRAIIDTIEADQEYLPKETPLCDWCGYWEHCPRKKHLIQIKEMPVKERKQEDGYVLVDRLTELREQKKLVETEMDEIKAKLTEYAKAHDLDVVRGTQMKAQVAIKIEERLPSKSVDKEAYEEIIQLVRDAGAWEQVSMLNAAKLNKDLKVGALPDDLTNKLEEYIIETESARVSLSQMKEGEEIG